jgi:DNA invertase Pin-like site-specific DNA recombinase
MRDPNARNNLDLLTGGMLIGYSRASLVDQNLNLQRDALERAGCAQIYEDKAIGRAKAGRQEMANALRSLRAGDMLVVWRLDRLSRNLTDLVNIINELAVKKIGFKSLTEKIDTSSALGGTFFEVFDSIAQYMRDVAHENAMAGSNVARARGRSGGRPTVLDAQAMKEIHALMSDPNISMGTIAERYKVSRATVYNALNRDKKNAPQSASGV